LARAKAEERLQRLGNSRSSLATPPASGKICIMLEAVRQRMNDTDLVIAYVETHGRVETEALLQGLEVLPRQEIEYRGMKLTEMNIDGVLAPHPQLALVPELAHTNAPGSRHVKR